MPILLKTEKIIFNLGAIASATRNDDDTVTLALSNGEQVKLVGQESADVWQLLGRAACTAKQRLKGAEPLHDL